jgi:hypothetical protein
MKKTWLVVALAIVAGGCGSPAGLVPVAGKVLYRGEPAAGAVVYFHREQAPGGTHQPIPSGIVEDDGSFYLTCDGLGDGCPPGKYAVLVEWKGKAASDAAPQPKPARGKTKAKVVQVNRRTARSGVDRLKGRYFDISKPLLHAEVVPGSSPLPAFELAD